MVAGRGGIDGRRIIILSILPEAPNLPRASGDPLKDHVCASSESVFPSMDPQLLQKNLGLQEGCKGQLFCSPNKVITCD